MTHESLLQTQETSVFLQCALGNSVSPIRQREQLFQDSAKEKVENMSAFILLNSITF